MLKARQVCNLETSGFGRVPTKNSLDVSDALAKSAGSIGAGHLEFLSNNVLYHNLPRVRREKISKKNVRDRDSGPRTSLPCSHESNTPYTPQKSHARFHAGARKTHAYSYTRETAYAAHETHDFISEQTEVYRECIEAAC